MFMCFVNWSSVLNLDLFWKQVFSYFCLSFYLSNNPFNHQSVLCQSFHLLIHLRFSATTCNKLCSSFCLTPCLSVHWHACLSVCLSTYFTPCLSVHLPVCPFVYLPTCLSVLRHVCPPVCFTTFLTPPPPFAVSLLSICGSRHTFLYVYLSVCPSVNFSVCLSISLSICTSVCLFCFFACYSICLSFSISVFQSVCLAFCLSVCLSFFPSFLSVFQSVCLAFFLSSFLSFFLSVCLSVSLSVQNNGLKINLFLFPFQFFTLGDKPSGQPRRIEVVSPSSDSLVAHWEDPAKDHWNGDIVGYVAGWRMVEWVWKCSFRPFLSIMLRLTKAMSHRQNSSNHMRVSWLNEHRYLTNWVSLKMQF